MTPTIVILLSDKRSGSTLFQRELCKHDLVQTVDYSSHTYLETHHWLKAAVLLNSNKNDFSGGKVYNGYGSKQNARTYLIDTVKGNCPDFEVPRSDKELVFNGWDALCEKFATPVFFEKSPQFLAHWACLELILEWIKQTSYSVKVIGLTRNPMAVLYSADKLFHTNPEHRQYGWMRIQRNLLKLKAQIADQDYLDVRYEDIVENPQELFAKVTGFIGLEPSKEVGQGAHRTSLSKWVDDPYYNFTLSEEVAAIAKEFGYSQIELNNPAKAATPLILRLKKQYHRLISLKIAQLRDRIIKPLRLRKKLRSLKHGI